MYICCFHHLIMQISKLQISRLLGSSTKSSNQLGYAQGCLLYLCGSYVIFYNPVIDEQIGYLKHSNPEINCLAVSEDQGFLALGGQGKYNNIWVYDLKQIGIDEPELLYTLKGHKNGVNLLAFSKGAKYLVSVGNKDGSMFIWEKQQRLSQNRNSRTLNRIIFDQNGDLITVGRGHSKIWPFEDGSISRVREEDCWMINGKTLNLGKKFALKEFIDVVSWREDIIALTADGILCLISKKDEKLSKCIDLMMQKTTSMDLVQNLIMCGGDNSLIKVIDLETLTLHSKFPKPPPTNKQNISVDEELSYNENEEFPQCKGVRKIGSFVISLYSNLTMFIWKMNPQIHALRSIITHKSKIKKIKVLEQIKGDITFFSTISADNTLRIWHFYKKCFHNRESIDIADLIGIKRNAYCRNLTRIIYTESEKQIISISGFLNQSIACISQRQFIMYSLDNFEITSHDTFSQNAIALEIKGNLAYVAFQQGKVCIYQVSDSLAKMRQIQFQVKIKSMELIDDHIIVLAQNQLIIYSLKRSSISFAAKQSICYTGAGHHIFVCKDDQSVSVYNTIKNKQNTFLSLKHELQENQIVTEMRSNSWLVMFLTNFNKIIIANFSSAIIHTQSLQEPINDMSLTETGQLILVGSYGNIIIHKLVSDQKFQQLEDEMKNWIEKNDLSWMHGSVWSRKKSNIEDRQKLLNSVQRSQSIQLSGGQNNNMIGDKSLQIMKVEVPNVQINYKSSENSMSMFNPSHIAEHANNIINKVNGMINQKSNSGQRSTRQGKRKIFNSSREKQNNNPNINLNNINNNNDTLLLSSPMKKIQSERVPQQQVPRFNNLVNSVVHVVQESPVDQPFYEKPSEHSFQNFVQGRENKQKSPYKIMDFQNNHRLQAIRQFDKNLKDESFIKEYDNELFMIYEKLQSHFGNREKQAYQKSVKDKFQNLSQEFLHFLSKKQSH